MQAETDRCISIVTMVGIGKTTPGSGKERLPILDLSSNVSRVPSANRARESFRAVANPRGFHEPLLLRGCLCQQDHRRPRDSAAAIDSSESLGCAASLRSLSDATQSKPLVLPSLVDRMEIQVQTL
jgi:hypothetical protein